MMVEEEKEMDVYGGYSFWTIMIYPVLGFTFCKEGDSEEPHKLSPAQTNFKYIFLRALASLIKELSAGNIIFPDEGSNLILIII